jgi:eukaryotic-like serine/threonine-protein kinase
MTVSGTVLLDRYVLTREIGRGGMATVYLADDRKHERQVAVKVLMPELSAEIESERFAREIKLVARLQHPHILPLYDSGELDGAFFFVMPFVEGESLRDRLWRERGMSLADTVALVRQIADALDYAHGRAVVHRDIKPENILLAGDQALLADFGIARGAAPADRPRDALTATGMPIGTPAYMSPEQANADSEVSGKSDVYSLGCVCYEMLSGAPPFAAVRGLAVIAAHLTKTPPPVTGFLAPLSDEIVAHVARALAKAPDERFASAGAFAGALEAALAGANRSLADGGRLQARQRIVDTRKAVFVLDFTNITGAQDVEWLSTGIAETIGVDLKKISGIRVVGNEASTRQRVLSARQSGTCDDPWVLELGRSLGALWVVWGSFQKAGSQIRLTAHFANTESDVTIPTDKIDGPIDQIFALQDRIVTSFAEVLRITVTREEMTQIARPETTDLTAYEHYAKGHHAFLQFGKESARVAAAHFRAALEIDAKYALAWAGLGSLLHPKYVAFGRREDLDEGVVALQRAIALDPMLSDPHAFLAYMYLRQNRYDDAVATARVATEREPGAHFPWHILGASLCARGLSRGTLADLARAVPPFMRCRALNPAFHAALLVVGALYALRGQYAHAAAMLDEAVAVERAGTGQIFLGSYVQRAALYMNAGQKDDAIPLLALALERYSSMDHVYAETMTAYAHFVQGCVDERGGKLDAAHRHFTASISIAEQYEHRFGVGSHWVKSHFGLARVLYRAGDHAGSTLALKAGKAMMESHSRFVWGPLVGTTDAETWYELASAHATRGEADDAVAWLQRASGVGWADLLQLDHDPAFAALGDRRIRDVCIQAAAAVVLPPPIGSGGLPDKF